MFSKNLRKKHRVEPSLDLTPLIDVVFQLLIFFMLTATFVVQSSIQIEMPEAKGATTLEQKDITITLAYGQGGPGGRGPVYIDSIEIFSTDELTRILSEKITEQPDIMLLVRADARIETGRLIEIFGIASSVGITNYGIQARPADETP